LKRVREDYSMTKPISWYARRYVERFGFHLVPIEPGRKFPRSSDWGNNTISDADNAEAFWQQRPDWNMGVALGPSRMCSLDIDCDASFAHILDEFGIKADELDGFPTIQGRKKGRRIMFRVPDGVNLGYQKMNWPSKYDPTGDKHKAAMAAAASAKAAGDTGREERIRAVARRWARYTVFELRSSCDGKQRQDVLPPSLHPDTGLPYVWLAQPTDHWPTPGAWLQAIWTDWDRFKPQINAMCPWLPAEKSQERKLERIKPSSHVGGSVINAFTDAHDLVTLLEQYGYQRKGRKRFLSPHSSTGLPGVILFPDGDSCWIHHASDPLCSEDSGKPVNAFDLYCYYEHSGDIKAAVKNAADLLGMDTHIRHTPQKPPQAAKTTATPSASRDYHSPLLWATDKGKPLKHIDNLREICRRLGVVIRYNVVKKSEELIIPGESFTMDNEANASLAWLSSECSLFDFPTDKLSEFITYLADQCQYNPVITWIQSRKWDGKPRLQSLCDTITARGQATESVKWMKETLIKRWMVAAVAAAYLPDGISAPGVLTLQGPQYLGKTKWFKTLVPQSLDLIQDGMILKPDDKDSVKQCTSYWLVELGELDSTFRKSDIAQLKAFITKQVDVLRLAYARRESRFPRRTLFFGSVNPREFLHDPTGNRRFWTIECEAINHDHGLDMQQVWAEVHSLWAGGEGYYLSADEMAGLNAHNEDFMAADPIEERLMDRLEWNEPQTLWRWAQASTVLVECGLDRPSKLDSATAGSLIRARNGNQSRRSNGQKLLLCPSVRR
jgi:hypothetical protein